MSRFCGKCGSELNDNGQFCPHCGASQDVNQNANQNFNQGVNQGVNPDINMNVNNINVNVQNPGSIPKREIPITIILSLVTCGFYALYWFICMTNDVNKVSNNPNGTSGGMALVLTLITCGFYGIYWNYNMGKKLYEAGKARNIDIADNSLLYLILSVFGLSIVNYCLIQNDLNRFAN